MKKFLFLWVALIATLNMSAAVTQMTCAEAADAAKLLQSGQTGTDSVAVTGYVTNTDGKISRGQQTFWMDDEKGSKKTFEGYWCNIPEGEAPLNVGDKVVIKGFLLRYKDIYEMKNGDITILERAIVKIDTIQATVCEAVEECEALEDGDNTQDVFVVEGIVSSTPEQNDTYNTQKFNVTCKDNNKDLQAYNVTMAEGYAAIGDKVRLTGKLKKYGTTLELIGSGVVLEKGKGIYNTYFADNNETGVSSTAAYDDATGVLTVDLASNFSSQWSAQVKLHHNIAFNSQAKYKLSMKLHADKDVKNITIKMDDEGEALYENQSINLTAGEDYVYTSQAVQGVEGNNKLLVFDFGYGEAGTHITISDITILVQWGNKAYYLTGDFNEWNIDAAPAFTQVSATDYELTVPTIYGGVKVLKTQGTWFPHWGAFTSKDTIMPGSGFYMQYCSNSYSSTENLYVGKQGMGYVDAKFRISISGNNMTMTFVSGKEYTLEDMPHSYYLVGAYCNWELQSAVKFEEENGVLTANIPNLSGEFKVVQDQTWSVQWGANRDSEATVKMGEPYTMGAKTETLGDPSNCTLGDIEYLNAKLTIAKNESGNMVLTLVSGDKVAFTCSVNATDKTATITSLLDKTLAEWDIPETIKGSDGTVYRVTEIAEDAMYQCTNLTSVTIPRYVTKIGVGALAGCTSLKTIIWNAIACPSITDDMYGQSIYNKFGGTAGYGVYDSTTPYITSFILGNEVEVIPSSLFADMTNLTSVTIPASAKWISPYAFSRSGITSVTWNANIGKCRYIEVYHGTRISETTELFSNIASQITSFAIGENVDSIPQGLCKDMANVVPFNIPQNVKFIGDDAFNGCTSITNITLGNALTYIGDNAFNGCTGMTNITLGNALTHIGSNAFAGTGIASVTIPEGVTYIGSGAFANTTNLKTIVWNVKALRGDYYREYYYEDESATNSMFRNAPVTSFTFGANVDSIPSRLCYGMNQLTSIIVPDNVALIGTRAFANTGITSITFPEQLQKLGNQVCNNTPLNTIVWNVRNLEEGGYYSGDEGLFGNVSAHITSFVIGDKVEVIPNGLCRGMNQLTTIPLSTNIRSIGEEAFAGTGIQSITIPENVKNVGYRICDGTPLSSVVWNAVSAHGSEPFLGVTEQITSFVLGDKVTYIPDFLCSGMEKLTNIAIPATVDSIGTRAFAGCSDLTSMVILGNLKYMGNQAFAYCTSLNKIEIKNVIEECEAYCFMGCTALDTLITSANMLEIYPTRNDDNSYLPKNIRYIKITGGELSDNAFEVINRNYKALRTLDLAAATNTSLADEAFKGCYNLETLALPSAMEEIPYMMAAECVSLKSITIPAATKVIGHRAFENCRLLRDVQFSANGQLTAIGNWAFYNCHELQSIAIPEGVTAVGYAAFYGCTYLADISLPSTVESIADNGFALCAKLGKMTVNAAIPPVVEAKTFENVSRSIPVYVPLQAVPQYRAAEVWKEFNIQGVATDLTTAEAQSDVNNTKLLRDGHIIILRNGHTYSLTGALIK